MSAVPPASNHQVFIGYLKARALVIEVGYERDLRWAEDLQHVVPDPFYVVSETAWVILNSGFRYAVARKKYPLIQKAFYDWDPSKLERDCVTAARQHLNHRGKIEAMYSVAEEVRRDGIARIVAEAADPKKLTRLPFIGKITCWHLAKVLGADVVKPDVHLQRAAAAAGKSSALELCKEIQTASGDRLTVIDSVLWRYGEQMQKQTFPDWTALWGST